MNPILFDKDETNFTTNGLGRLECISCEVIEERNGMYELEAEVPISGNHAADIEQQSIIGVIPHDGGNIQAFYVYKIGKPINGKFKVYARHISYRLTDIPCSPFSVEISPTAATDTLAGLKANAIEECPFYFYTDLTTPAPYTQKTPASIRQRLGGVEGSVLDQFGGEFEWDNFNVHLWKQRGRLANVTGISLRYGKNITDIDQEEEISNTVTGVVPFWIDTDGNNLVMLPELVVYSEYADNYPYHLTQVLDLSGEYENKPTVNQLRGAATTYVNKTGLGIPKVSIKVSFVNLWETEEYKDIAPLERVQLCDEVIVNFEELGVSAIAKVVKTRYDVLKERYIQIEVGSIRTTLAQAVTDRDKDIDTAFVSTITKMSQAVHTATAWLTNANGYVVARLNEDGSWKELLFMNTNDPATATSGIRINNNGIGFFSKVLYPAGNVLDGPYSTAWTIDGRLGDAADKNFWNFITGDFSLSAGTTVGGQTVQQIADAAQAAAEATSAQALATAVSSLDDDIADLQNQIDGNIATWFYSGVPTLNNLPASQWTTTEEKNNHLGDLYYDTNTDYAYRFMLEGSTYKWDKLSDADISAALRAAQDAQATADSKIITYAQTSAPTGDLDVGDLWIDTDDNNKLYRWNGTQWVAVPDSSALNAFKNGDYATFVTNTNNSLNAKITTYYQTSAPTTTIVGDLWIDTDDSNKLYRWSGTQWVLVRDTGIQSALTAAANAQTTADGKIVTYAQTSAPTNTLDNGDLWIDTDDNNKLYRWNGSQWVALSDKSEIVAYDNQLNQLKVFNKLTNNGQTMGIYLNSQDNKLYINATYIQSGKMSASIIEGGVLLLGGYNNTNGEFEIRDASSNVIVKGDKDGLTTTHLIATDDSEFGNLKIGKKTIEPFGVPIEVSYIYAEGYKELFWNEWSSLSNTFRKQVYFSPFYDGWTDDNTIIISFVCDDTGSHDTTQVCRITLYKWNGSSWVSQGYRRFNPNGDEIDGKSDDFGPFYKTDSDIYKLSIIVSKQTWASNYELDVYTNWQNVLEADPYETVSSFRGSFTGSAQLYSMSVGDMEVKPNGNIAYDDSESNANYSVSPDGFSSASSSTNYTELTALTNPSIKAYYSSSKYIEFSAPTNPKLEIYSSNSRYIKATGSQLRINYDSSQYILINSSTPSLEVNNSSDDYIYLDDTEVTIHSASNTYAKFRGSANLVAYRSGTSYSIAWTSSDRRYKENIIPLDVDLSKNLIDATEPKRFKFINEDGTHYGMIAQEARELLDNLGETDARLEYCSDEDNDFDPRNINYQEYIPHLINYVKDLRAIVNSQKAEIEELKAIVKKLSV